MLPIKPSTPGDGGGRSDAGAGDGAGAGGAQAGGMGGDPSRPIGPDNTPFDVIGGEVRVRALVDRFYDVMDTDPAAKTIRDMHPPDLAESRDKLSDFLCGWMGGPQHYIQKHGHPRLRMRHMHVSIGEAERDQWLMCMARAMDDLGVTGELRTFLDGRFAHVADFMRNRPAG